MNQRRSEKKDREKRLKKNKTWYDRKKNDPLFKQMNVDRAKQWAKDHPEVIKGYSAKKRAYFLKRIPKWADVKNIEFIYKNCPDNMEVDHIVPLKGKLVSGLHVSWNLQYLTPTENGTKWNKINLLEASERYGKILEQVRLK